MLRSFVATQDKKDTKWEKNDEKSALFGRFSVVGAIPLTIY